MRSLLDPTDRQRLFDRFHTLGPDTPGRWGRMSASNMLAHLCDQMRHTVGDVPTRLRLGPLRIPGIRQALMYWLPWPHGLTRGPFEAFLTRPTTWAADLETFETLVRRFVEQEGRTDWPHHAFFGAMTRQSWGYFCHRHFDYHLRQFGA
jgi:hypothetical protein